MHLQRIQSLALYYDIFVQSDLFVEKLQTQQFALPFFQLNPLQITAIKITLLRFSPEINLIAKTYFILYCMYSKYFSSRNYSPFSAPKVYPEDIQCIIDPVNNKGGVYLSNVEAAQNINTLKRLNIKAVLTAASGVILSHPKNQIHSTKYIPADDRETFDISKYFDEAAEWIHENLQTTNILIHCMAGISRSVSLLLAYLIKVKEMKYHEAFDMVKRRRRIINPNNGFIRQLKNYEQNNRNKSTLHRDRTPSPKTKYSLQSELRLSATPTTVQVGDQNSYKTSDRYESTASKLYSADKYAKSSYLNDKNRLSQQDLDRKIEEIRKKYSSKSQYQPLRPQTRMHSSYKQTRATDNFDYKNYGLSKYYNRGYGMEFGDKISERLRNPEMFEEGRRTRLYNNFLIGGGY